MLLGAPDLKVEISYFFFFIFQPFPFTWHSLTCICFKIDKPVHRMRDHPLHKVYFFINYFYIFFLFFTRFQCLELRGGQDLTSHDQISGTNGIFYRIFRHAHTINKSKSIEATQEPEKIIVGGFWMLDTT